MAGIIHISSLRQCHSGIMRSTLNQCMHTYLIQERTPVCTLCADILSISEYLNLKIDLSRYCLFVQFNRNDNTTVKLHLFQCQRWHVLSFGCCLGFLRLTYKIKTSGHKFETQRTDIRRISIAPPQCTILITITPSSKIVIKALMFLKVSTKSNSKSALLTYIKS